MTRTPLVLAAALCALTGCTFVPTSPTDQHPPTESPGSPSERPGDPQRSPSERPGDPQRSPSEGQRGEESPTPTTAATPAEPTPTARPAVVREASEGGVRARAEFFPLRREGRATIATVRMTVLEAGGWRNMRSIASGPIHAPVAHLDLVDPATATVHQPSKADFREACGPYLPYEYQPGDVVWATCVFGPLPTTTRTVSVRFGVFGSADAVPVA